MPPEPELVAADPVTWPIAELPIQRNPSLKWAGGQPRKMLEACCAVDHCLLVLTGRRAFGRGGRPQHDRPVDQVDLEPVAAVQAKLLP